MYWSVDDLEGFSGQQSENLQAIFLMKSWNPIERSLAIIPSSFADNYVK